MAGHHSATTKLIILHTAALNTDTDSCPLEVRPCPMKTTTNVVNDFVATNLSTIIHEATVACMKPWACHSKNRSWLLATVLLSQEFGCGSKVMSSMNI